MCYFECFFKLVELLIEWWKVVVEVLEFFFELFSVDVEFGVIV